MSRSDSLLIGELHALGRPRAASASAVELRDFAAPFTGSSGVCFSMHDFPWLNQGSPLSSSSNSFVCCLTMTSAACHHSEEGGGNAVGSTGTEFHLHERATPLCSCGTEGCGLEGDLWILHLQLDLMILKFFSKLNWREVRNSRNLPPYQPDPITATPVAQSRCLTQPGGGFWWTAHYLKVPGVAWHVLVGETCPRDWSIPCQAHTACMEVKEHVEAC